MVLNMYIEWTLKLGVWTIASTFLVLNTLGRQTKLSASLSRKNSPVFFWISCHNFCNSFEPWSAYGSVPRVFLKSIVQPPSCSCYHMWNHSGHCGPSFLASFALTSVNWGIWMSQYDDAQFPWLWPPNWKYLTSEASVLISQLVHGLKQLAFPHLWDQSDPCLSSPQIILSWKFTQTETSAGLITFYKLSFLRPDPLIQFQSTVGMAATKSTTWIRKYGKQRSFLG